MADELKNFPASELKLERLRKAGVVALSSDLLTFGLILGLGIGVVILLRTASDMLPGFIDSTFASAGSFADASAQQNAWRELFLNGFDILLMLLLATLLPIFIAIIFFGLFQTRFLFTFEPLSIDFGRVFSLSNLFTGLFSRFIQTLFRALLLLAWLFVAFTCFHYFLGSLFPGELLDGMRSVELLGIDKSSLPSLAESPGIPLFVSALSAFFLISLAFSFFVGILSYFSTLWAFQRSHRMTRAEVEEEYREMEQSSDVRSAFNQDEESE